jgi:hypothetical protein
MAAPVDLNKAQRVAGNIYAERSNTGVMDGFNLRSVDMLNENAVNLLYVFQLESAGFILVPGDDRVQPLLAYSFESPFFIEDVPQNVAWMIDAYKDVVRYAIESDESPTEKVNAEWEKYYSGNGLNARNRDIKGPLLLSHWNQSGGWNNYGPPDDGTCSGDEAPSGCVAVSMAAIMHYWQYPVSGEDDNQCYCGGYGTQYADFGDAFYDYGAMGNAESASDAAAFLAWHAGVAVNMDYECEGSGAQVTGGYPSTEYAMKNYFRYKTSIYDTAPYSWSDAQWVAKLQDEISANRPFIYVGYNDEGGHAWNCDGYDGELFHMNWGWGGQSDGWFTVTGPDDPDGWGSGSHVLINIEPEELNRPNLRLTTFSSYETSGDGDAVINPGETFEIVIELENPAPWSAASSIELLLTTEDEGVYIDDNTSSIISFETLQSGEIFSNASMPFIIDVDGDIALGDKIFNLMVMGVGIEGAEDNFYFKNYELEVLVSLNQFGFPMYEASQKTSPLAVDFDGDGADEIIFGDYNGFIHVLSSDGSELIDETFPFDTGNQVWGAVAGADMDGDGLMDIAVVSKSKHFYLLDKNGLKLDFDSEKYLLGTPAIGNLDGDADLEVVFSGYSSGNMVWALNADGSSVDGFPLDLGEKVKIGVALADFNGNGKDDIVVGTDSDYIHLFYDDGSEAPGFPYQVGDKIQSAPAILDVDGQKVIFVGCNDNNLYAINSDGSLRFSVPTTNKVFNSPAFLEHNNSFYVFFSDDSGLLYAVDTDGNALSGWPVDAEAVISKSVAFADLDGDGSAEVIAVTEMADVLAYNLDGSSHAGFPMGNEFVFTSAPLVMDMDEDGDLEILAGSVNSLVSIDVKSAGSSDGYWSMYRGNALRTGYYNISDDESCTNDAGDVNEDGTLNILDIVLVANAVLGGSLSGCGLEAADMNGDGTLNILDIVQIANAILGSRSVDATSAEIKRTDDALRLMADGYIGGVQMTLKHGSDFSVDLTKYALHADYITEDNKTTLVVVVPEREEIFTYSGDFEITDMMIANSHSEIKMNVPGKFELNQAYPNPFNPSTSISLHMPMKGNVSVGVYDLNGRLVQTLLSGVQSEGDYNITWNAANQSSGMYLIRATMEKQTAIQKVLLLK